MRIVRCKCDGKFFLQFEAPWDIDKDQRGSILSLFVGEIVIVIGPPGDGAATELFDLDAALGDALRHASLRDAAAAVAAASGLPKRRVYARALELAKAAGEAQEP